MFKKPNTQYLILAVILLVAAFLRFYRLSDMANYDFDHEYAANFAYAVIHDTSKLLIGQELSVAGLFMGPWYFYFLTPFFALTNLHPIGGYIASCLLGLTTVAVYFFVARKLFGVTAGLIAASFRATLYTQVNGDWAMVPTYSSDLSVLIVWFCFYKYWQKDSRFLPLLFLTFGLFTSFHPIQFPFYLVFFMLFLLVRKLPTINQTILSFVAFILPQASLILFEHWHNWLEVKRLISLFTTPATESKTLANLWSYTVNSLLSPRDMLNLGFIPATFFIICLLTILVWLISRKIGFWKEKFHWIMLLTTTLVFIIYYWRFPTHVPEYYFGAVQALAVLYTAASLSLLTKNRWSKYFLPVILIWIFFINFQMVWDRWNNPSLITLSHKDAIVKQILATQPEGQPFYVSYIKSPGWNFGFDYLFKLYGRQTSGNREDPVYTIVIPKNLSPDSIQFSSGNIGLIYPDKKP